MNTTRQVLENIKVVEFAWWGVGPFVGQYLGMHGAEVGGWLTVRSDATTSVRPNWHSRKNISVHWEMKAGTGLRLGGYGTCWPRAAWLPGPGCGQGDFCSMLPGDVQARGSRLLARQVM